MADPAPDPVPSSDRSGRPLVAQIVACSRNRMIGRDGRLPWSIPEDWRYFMDQTKGGTLVMGRVCFEGMVRVDGWREDRDYVVISRDRSLGRKYGVAVVGSVGEALESAAALGRTVWICGGERIYEETMERADRLYLTLIDAEVDGDTRFPEWSHVFTREVSRRESRDEQFTYTFYVLEK